MCSILFIIPPSQSTIISGRLTSATITTMIPQNTPTTLGRPSSTSLIGRLFNCFLPEVEECSVVNNFLAIESLSLSISLIC